MTSWSYLPKVGRQESLVWCRKARLLRGLTKEQKLYCWDCLLFGAESGSRAKDRFSDLGRLSKSASCNQNALSHLNDSNCLKILQAPEQSSWPFWNNISGVTMTLFPILHMWVWWRAMVHILTSWNSTLNLLSCMTCLTLLLSCSTSVHSHMPCPGNRCVTASVDRQFCTEAH